MTIAVKPQVVALHRIALERSNAHPEHCTPLRKMHIADRFIEKFIARALAISPIPT